MSDFKEIKPEEFTVSPFRQIGDKWMLIAAEKDGRVNAMTASWGGLGVMWRKPAAFVVIRPQRFTKELVDGSTTFSLNFFDESRRDDLFYFGSTSGRDENKIEKCGLTVGHAADAPYFAEAEEVIIVHKLFAQPYDKQSFTEQAPDSENYPNGDYHTLYIGEITKIMVRK